MLDDLKEKYKKVVNSFTIFCEENDIRINTGYDPLELVKLDLINNTMQGNFEVRIKVKGD